jgi:hypothetical protein
MNGKHDCLSTQNLQQTDFNTILIIYTNEVDRPLFIKA